MIQKAAVGVGISGNEGLQVWKDVILDSKYLLQAFVLVTFFLLERMIVYPSACFRRPTVQTSPSHSSSFSPVFSLFMGPGTIPGSAR